ncbi:uncharacterized protein LOC115963234 isoform X2 [Quercus lobata]|uniref:uncharacterized protein LOC115963234 isoform X2 n=1 Tax=Quercus lobata TaxID=97700 RepID=UPI0012482F93|nr:uncharacterized protein LOC115963234 isoform X2 [Quercus lobata]
MYVCASPLAQLFAPLPSLPSSAHRSQPRLAHPGGPLRTNKAAALAKFLETKLPRFLSHLHLQRFRQRLHLHCHHPLPFGSHWCTSLLHGSMWVQRANIHDGWVLDGRQ